MYIIRARNNYTKSISFDICEAFRSSVAQGTIEKIEAVGIRGKLALWFQNCLQNRKQAVVIKGKKSEYKAVPSGVPQESVLGLLLFFMYINDITKNIESVIKQCWNVFLEIGSLPTLAKLRTHSDGEIVHLRSRRLNSSSNVRRETIVSTRGEVRSKRRLF